MGVAADCVYTSQYGSTQNASQQIISTFNTASALYKSTFNVSLGIIELQVHDPLYVIPPRMFLPRAYEVIDVIDAVFALRVCLQVPEPGGPRDTVEYRLPD